MRLLPAFLLTLALTAFGAEEWRAGSGRQVITPDFPMRMAGYEERDKPTEIKLHDLWVKALAIQDPSGAHRLLITMDLIGIDKELSDQISQSIMDEYKLTRDSIIISVSHTHTGPIVGTNLRSMFSLTERDKKQIADYSKFLAERSLKAVNDAMKNLKPATLHWANGSATFAVNRRENKERNVPALQAAGQLKGPVDHEVPVLKVSAPDGTLLAVVFGYACHGTTLNFMQWSGDYPGFAQLNIEKSHPGTTALFFAGCGADQNPLPRRTVALAEKYGKSLSDAVEEVLKQEMHPIAGKSAARFTTFELPFEKLPDQAQLDTWMQDKDHKTRRYAEYLSTQLKERGSLKKSYPYPAQAWQLGDLTLVALGGEVVVDYSLRLKKELALGHTWVAGYCNDVMAYIPSQRVWKEGGYEARDSMQFYGLPSAWDPSLEETIIARVHELVKEIGTAPKP